MTWYPVNHIYCCIAIYCWNGGFWYISVYQKGCMYVLFGGWCCSGTISDMYCILSLRLCTWFCKSNIDGETFFVIWWLTLDQFWNTVGFAINTTPIFKCVLVVYVFSCSWLEQGWYFQDIVVSKRGWCGLWFFFEVVCFLSSGLENFSCALIFRIFCHSLYCVANVFVCMSKISPTLTSACSK